MRLQHYYNQLSNVIDRAVYRIEYRVVYRVVYRVSIIVYITWCGHYQIVTIVNVRLT